MGSYLRNPNHVTIFVEEPMAGSVTGSVRVSETANMNASSAASVKSITTSIRNPQVES